MMKKFLSAILASVMLIATIPSAGMASTGEENLNTTANEDIYTSDAQPLLDTTYQYCVEGDEYFAYMWVPENAMHLNGVMIAKSNLIEERLMDSLTLRNVLKKYNIGIVYMHTRNTTDRSNESTVMGDFDYRDGYDAGARLDEMLARFAAVSGYDELKYAPIIGIGHSAGMGLGKALASWDPHRTIAQVCLKGGTSLTIPGVSGAGYVGDNYEIHPGVPTYLEAGQFTEHAGYDNPAGKDNYIDNDIKNITKIRNKGTNRLITMSVEWESGHYDWSEKSNEMLGKYLDTVIPLRLGEQATSSEKIKEDYTLVDLSQTGYVSDVKVYGSRLEEYDESEYSHGDVSDFTADEQKNMAWFPSEELYTYIKEFTADRKDVPVTLAPTEEPEVEALRDVFPAVEQQFDSKSGSRLTGNYIRYDKSMLFTFNTEDTKGDTPIDSAVLSFIIYHGNKSRNFKISQYNTVQDGTVVEIPSGDNSVVISDAVSQTAVNEGGKVNIDVTDNIKTAIENGAQKVSFVVEITDSEKAAYEAGVAGGTISGYPNQYSGSDMYLSTSANATDATRAKLSVTYITDTSRIYPSLDEAFEETSGIPNQWQGYLHYIQVTGDNRYYDIMLGFDMSKIDTSKTISEAGLSLTRIGAAGGHKTNVYAVTENPWASGTYNPDVVAGVTEDDLVATYDGNSTVIDITDTVKSNKGMVYFLLRYANRDSEQSGNDYYSDSVCGTKYKNVADEDSKRPQIVLAYEGDKTPVATPKVTKHQYLQLEDPSAKIPKPFTRITRYDAVNPNDSSYADGIANDPMTFTMYVDKMGVVSPDHIGAGEKIQKTSDTPAVITPVMAPVEWVGVERVELTDADIENNVSSKWRNVLRWKNNRVYYRLPSQDSYMNLNAFDVYNDNGLEFSYATNTFMIYPLFVSGGKEQHIEMADVGNVEKDFAGFSVNPKSSADLTVDLMVEYGPIKATLQDDGSYYITPDQIPEGATYPIECKLVATQFGVNNNGTKINTATPVEKIFYIKDVNSVEELPLNGEINQNNLSLNGVTGFNVLGTGKITLKMDNNTAFNAERAAQIRAEHMTTDDENYAKHYIYPEGYNPYECWNDYPGEWTVEVKEEGFVPLSSFTNGDKTSINLKYLNTVVSEGVTKIVPVTEQTEVAFAKANPWGMGANIVWQTPKGDAYDEVRIYVNNGSTYELKNTVSSDRCNGVVSGLEKGSHKFKITTVKNGVESDGVVIYGTVDGKTHLVNDFETGDLTSAMTVLEGQKTQSAYAWSNATGASLLLSGDDNNHYLAMQNNYTSSIQTANIEIPGGISADMTDIKLDIKVDMLEASLPSGQVYFELYNPVNGKSYGVEKGSDFVTVDDMWQEDYTLSLSSFNLPTDEEELSNITVLKIGRKVVGGGNNNRRAKIYLDNISLMANEPVKLKKLTLSYDNVVKNHTSLPNGFAPDENKVNYLFDGDTSNANLYTSSAQKRLYIDLGAEYEIAKIRLTDCTTKGTLMIGAGNTDPATISSHDEAFKTILRTNGSTQNGVASSYEEIKDEGETVIGRQAIANNIYQVSGFEKVRYISLFDWSNSTKVSELEIYVIDNTPEPETGNTVKVISTNTDDKFVTVNIDSGFDGVAIAALYDGDGKLEDVLLHSDNSAKKEFKFNKPSDLSGYKVRIMNWNSILNMVPYGDAIELSFE